MFCKGTIVRLKSNHQITGEVRGWNFTNDDTLSVRWHLTNEVTSIHKNEIEVDKEKDSEGVLPI